MAWWNENTKSKYVPIENVVQWFLFQIHGLVPTYHQLKG